MPFSPQIAEKPTVGQIREHLKEAGDYLVGLQAVDREKRGADWSVDAKSAIDFIHHFDAVHSAYEKAGLTNPLNVDGKPVATQVRSQLPATPRTIGQMFVEDDTYQSFSKKNLASSTFHELELRGSLYANNGAFDYYNPELETRTLLDTDKGGAAGDAGYFIPVGQPTALPIRTRQRRMFLRDLIPTVTTNLASIPYIRELNAAALEGGASAVAEGAAKPEVEMRWEQDDAPVRKIAAWIPATTEIIDDAPTLRGYIDTRLSYLLAIREEQILINGSGVSPQLKGILNFTGVQTQAAGADVPITLANAIALIENVDGEADAIVMNPIKFWSAIATRNANLFDGYATSNGLNNGLPFSGPPNGYWGMPTIRTRALASNKALVGSFALGATILDRLRPTIRVGNQHSDYFTLNKVVILAEERLALAVHRADFFVDVTLP